MRIRLAAWILGVLAAVPGCGRQAPEAGAEAAKTRILCTIFPVHQIARNVAQGREAVEIALMLPPGLGCPHDYALTPQDMKKLSESRVLIVNGLGLEEFLGEAVRRANAGIKVIDSTEGIGEVLRLAEDGAGHGEEGGEHGRGGRDAGVNPHLFASPRMAACMARTIAAGLSKADPDGAALYRKNAEAFAARLEALAGAFKAAGKSLRNNRIVTQHGVFDYLARDMGLEIVAVVQAHGGQEPSAGEMLRVVERIRERKAGAVFTEPQYPAKTGETLARETGIAAAVLDPVATGPEDAGPEYYEAAMKANLETLRRVLGTK